MNKSSNSLEGLELLLNNANALLALLLDILLKYPHHTQLVHFGCQSIGELLEIGGHSIAMMMIEKNGLMVMNKVLMDQTDVECVKYICDVVSKTCKHGRM